jgi:hypothetical protein
MSSSTFTRITAPESTMPVVRCFAVVLLVLSGLLLTAGRVDAQPQGAEHIIGVWRLVSFVEQRPNGEVVPSGRYGPRVTGMLAYDKSGAMMAQLMNPDRPLFAADNATQGTAAEVKAAFDGYNAYFGTFSVDARASIIRHKVSGNLFPNAVGTEFVRRYRVAGDSLILELPPMAIQGEQRVVRLIWRRVE